MIAKATADAARAPAVMTPFVKEMVDEVGVVVVGVVVVVVEDDEAPDLVSALVEVDELCDADVITLAVFVEAVDEGAAVGGVGLSSAGEMC